MKSNTAPHSSTVPMRRVARVISPETWKVDGVGALILIALSAAGYLLGASPLLARHASVQEQQLELVAARGKSAEVQTSLARVQQQLAVAQGLLAASPLRLQPATILNQRLASVTGLAGQGGVGLDDVQPGKSVAGPQYDTLPIHVTGTGSFPAFTALVHRLRQEFPDTGISSFNISGTPQEADVGAKFSMDLLWYTAPLKAAAKTSAKREVP